MTREEAIEELSYIADEMPSMDCKDWIEAINMAILALKQETVKMNNINEQITELEAYRLIRKKARNMLEPVDDATLGAYVRGVVDLQTELYGLTIKEVRENKE